MLSPRPSYTVGGLADVPSGPPAYPPYGAPPANAMAPYMGQHSGMSAGTPPPTYDAPFSYTMEPPPSGNRFPWPAVISVAMVIVFLLGMGAGYLIMHHATAPATITIGSSNAPSIKVSSSVTSLQSTVESVSAAVQPAVVEITSTGGNQEAIGSGDILTQDGYIVTNDHVVQGFTAFTVTLSNHKNYVAQVIGQAPQEDLAVIKINATGLQTISLADSSTLQVGEFAIAVGNPLGLQSTATFGIVSALNRTASEAPSGPAGTLTGLVQTSAPINPGNSGGALVDLQGQLIGIPTLGEVNPQTGANAAGIGYAISSNRVAFVTKQLIATGQVTSTGEGFLGIAGEDVTPALAQQDGLSVQSGVLVADFANDATGASPAQAAGVQKGDVIVGLDSTTINASSDLAGVLLNDAPGTKVTLKIVRGTQQLTIPVTLGERPTNLNG